MKLKKGWTIKSPKSFYLCKISRDFFKSMIDFFVCLEETNCIEYDKGSCADLQNISNRSESKTNILVYNLTNHLKRYVMWLDIQLFNT